jgi:hypothetical protein
MIIAGFSNADYKNCVATEQIISGNIIQLNNSTISGRCKNQKSVETRMCEAEYMSHTLPSIHCTWVKNFVEELNVPLANTSMCIDNKPFIDIADHETIGGQS